MKVEQKTWQILADLLANQLSQITPCRIVALAGPCRSPPPPQPILYYHYLPYRVCSSTPESVVLYYPYSLLYV
jgi:hypothetical protein